MVPEVDEQDAAVVADAVAPSRKPDGLANIALAKVAAFVGAITMHLPVLCALPGTSQDRRVRRAKSA
jgi:hypothetical protein